MPLREYTDRDTTTCLPGVNLSRTLDGMSVNIYNSVSPRFHTEATCPSARLVRPDELSVSIAKKGNC